MNRMTLLKAIGNIDDKYIEEAIYINDNEIKLINIDSTKEKPIGSKKRFRHFVPACLAAAAALILLVIGVNVLRPVSNKDDEVMIGNPMETIATMAEAEKITGFGLEAPETIQGSELSEITVISGDTIEVDYIQNGEIIASVRKAKGDEDISGDYNTYSQTETVAITAGDVTIKGNDGTYYLATWTSDGYSYSFSSEGGISKADIIRVIDIIR